MYVPWKYQMKISINKFHKTKGELRELDKENNIKLLRLLEYLRRRNVKNEKQNRVEKN